MTRAQKLAYGFFGQMVILLLLYAAAVLFGAAKFLPADPLATSLPYTQVSALADVLLHLAIVSGLLGGGIYAVVALRTSQIRGEIILVWIGRAWTLLLLIAVLAGLLGLLDPREGAALPPALVLVECAFIAIVTIIVASYARKSPILRVWAVGMALLILTLLIGLLSGDYVRETLLHTFAASLRANLGYVMPALALGSLLIRRFSTVLTAWADESLYNLAWLTAWAGGAVALSSVYPLVAPPGLIAFFAAPLLWLIAAAHAYRALAHRGNNATLAPHWFALAILCWLIGIGFLGGILAAPFVRQWTLGTRLDDAQAALTLFAPVALLLGLVNQAGAELHGVEGRITGFIPFWLVSFGGIGSALALVVAGVAQVYMERVLSLGYLDTQTLLVPLYVVWVIALLGIALGVGIYALAFWIRRPREMVTDVSPESPPMPAVPAIK